MDYWLWYCQCHISKLLWNRIVLKCVVPHIANKVTRGTRDVSFSVRYKWTGLENIHYFLLWQYSIYIGQIRLLLWEPKQNGQIFRNAWATGIRLCKSQFLPGLRLTSRPDVFCVYLLFSRDIPKEKQQIHVFIWKAFNSYATYYCFNADSWSSLKFCLFPQ